MKTSFQFIALPHGRFEHLFGLSDEELQAAGARRVIVDEKPGSPCRISLEDIEVDDAAILIHFVHHDVASPYRGSGAIYIREGARTVIPAVDEIPFMFTHRLLSVRGYDDTGMMVATAVSKGSELREAIGRLFNNDVVSYLHIHNAGPGCFNCSVVRA